ncbi:hypothetical protein [Pseudomonas beijingensis]|uniref:hypothetical protein n=1 Tax=Pseudomonas beijingensis TaxID=2954101 RepID=UPI002735824E|nr:hypothetical protein [Pseudomonas sp. FP2262]WLH45700.1 hypothetical protein PSH83_25710 [Pseudomonas sp. FP2262]
MIAQLHPVRANTRVIEDPLFLALMFISAFAAICILNWLASGPEVLGFCFDERQQRLSFTQRRAALPDQPPKK